MHYILLKRINLIISGINSTKTKYDFEFCNKDASARWLVALRIKKLKLDCSPF
jgi:hypothetical protein